MPILTQRKKEIFELFIQGRTYADIGRRLGISAQSAFNSIAPPRSVFKRIRKRAQGRCEECGIICGYGHIHHEQDDMVTVDDVTSERCLWYLCPTCHRNRHIFRNKKRSVK